MNLKDYIHNLQQRPIQQRKRIAFFATAIGFFVILLIWVASFNEMNKPIETQADPTSASLNDLKNNFETGKDSIQNMMQQLPNQTGTTGTDTTSGTQNSEVENSIENTPSVPSTDSVQNPENDSTENSLNNEKTQLIIPGDVSGSDRDSQDKQQNIPPPLP